jgi:hypothetical protein
LGHDEIKVPIEVIVASENWWHIEVEWDERLLVLHDMLVVVDEVVDEVENDVLDERLVHDNENLVESDALHNDDEVEVGAVLDASEHVQRLEVMVDADIIVKYLEHDIGTLIDEDEVVAVLDEYDIVDEVVVLGAVILFVPQAEQHIEVDEVEEEIPVHDVDTNECSL